jgi:hypothetical protein
MFSHEDDTSWQAALASSPSLRALVLANGEEHVRMAWELGRTTGQLETLRGEIRRMETA